MRFCKRFGAVLVATGGMAGIAICVAAIAIAWSIAARLSDLNDLAHDGIDRSAAAVRERVLDAQQLVAQSKLTSESLRQGLANWAKEAAVEHAAAKLEIQAKAEQLDSALAQIDRYMELAAATADTIHQTVELAAKLGLHIDAAAADSTQGRFAGVRSQLQQASETLADVRRRIAEVGERGPLGESARRVIQLALRVVATVGEIDDRLADAAQKLEATQAWARESKTTTRAWIVVGKFAISTVMAWLALGQAALCYHGWKTLQRCRPASVPRNC